MSIGDEFIRWAKSEPSILGLVLIGSRARSVNAPGAADAGSDWDFQVITTRPHLFETQAWCLSGGIAQPIVYVYRSGRLGHAPKVSAMFYGGDIDIVVITNFKICLAFCLYRTCMLDIAPNARRAVHDLALVLRGGYSFLKSNIVIRAFYAEVCQWREGEGGELTDEVVMNLWKGFLCDFKSVVSKIDRGEFRAAQRWIHLSLGETNFVLMHELRRRRHLVSFPDARRIERVMEDDWAERIAIDCRLERRSLLSAAEKCLHTCRLLMESLSVTVPGSERVGEIFVKFKLALEEGNMKTDKIGFDGYH